MISLRGAPCARTPWMSCLLPLLMAVFVALLPSLARAEPLLARFQKDVPAASLMPGADAYGPIRSDLPVAPILKGGETIGWAFLTSDFVGTTGYSGKPIHVMVAIGPDAVLRSVKLVKHSEPIVLIGIPEARIAGLAAAYTGLDLAAEAAAGGSAHELNIISGATVTVMVIDDSIVRSGIRVARALGLGGLTPLEEPSGPRAEIDPDVAAATDWQTLVGDGSVRRLSLDVGQINRALEEMDDPRAQERPEPGDPADTFIDLYTGLVSVPGIGRSLLGEREYPGLAGWLKQGENAIVVAARGS